jgi:hypothetical protein
MSHPREGAERRREDEGVRLCSVRTMYRILDSQDEVRERRNQLTHPTYKKPELLATGPNQVSAIGRYDPPRDRSI